MIVKVSNRGWSFKGAGLYYLNPKRDQDGKAPKEDRVGFTYAHNIPTEDAQRAINLMAYTAKNADVLKRQAGVSNRGRKQKLGEVYSYSVAWHPSEEPDEQTMKSAAMESLKKLNLDKDYQALFVQHKETAHDHVHVIVNLISLKDGKIANVGNDQVKLSKWAEEYELEHGGIICEQRIQNNEKRRELAKEKEQRKEVRRAEREAKKAWEKIENQKERDGNKKQKEQAINDNEKPYEKKPFKKWDRDTGVFKHREQKIDKAQIQDIYLKARNAAEFNKSLDGAGYSLARGDRRGVILVNNKTGKTHSLSRQISSLWKRDDVDQKWKGGLENRFADFDERGLYNVEATRKYIHEKIQNPPSKVDYEIERQKKLVDASIEAEKEKMQKAREQKKQTRLNEENTKKETSKKLSKFKTSLKFDWEFNVSEGIKKETPDQKNYVNDDAHLVKLDRQQDWDREAQRKRLELELHLKKEYERQSTVNAMKTLIQDIKNSKGKQLKELKNELHILRLNLENIDMRINERRNTLEKELNKTNPYLIDLNKSQESEPSNVIDLETEQKKRRVEELKAQRERTLRQQEKDNQSKDRDKDQGFDLAR